MDYERAGCVNAMSNCCDNLCLSYVSIEVYERAGREYKRARCADAISNESWDYLYLCFVSIAVRETPRGKGKEKEPVSRSMERCENLADLYYTPVSTVGKLVEYDRVRVNEKELPHRCVSDQSLLCCFTLGVSFLFSAAVFWVLAVAVKRISCKPMHPLSLGFVPSLPSPTKPGLVSSNIHDCPVSLISTIELDWALTRLPIPV